MSQECYLFLFHIVFYAGYAWSIENFLNKYLDRPKHAGKIFALLLFLNYAIGNAICLSISYLAGVSFYHLMFFLLALLLFRAETEKKLSAAAILIVCVELTSRFAASGVNLIWLALSQKIPEKAAAIYSGCQEYLISILGFAAFLAAAHFLKKPLASVFGRKIKKWYLMLSIPLIVLIIIMDLAEWGATKGIMVRGEDRWNLYYNQLFSHGANLLLSLLAMCAACFYIFGMDRIYLEQKRKEQYQAKVEFYAMLEEQYRQMERLRHDMKNHVTALQGLAEQRDWEKMKHYLQKIAVTGAFEGSEEATGNQVVDALLYQKRKEAQRKGIRWEADMQVPKKCGVDDFDFCVLIGNILDNAIEACEKLPETSERFISIRSGMQKCFFLLEVRNSTELKDMGCVVYAGKSRRRGRGIGLLNILEAAQKYHGTVETELEGRVFTISVLLLVPPVGDF